MTALVVAGLRRRPGTYVPVYSPSSSAETRRPEGIIGLLPQAEADIDGLAVAQRLDEDLLEQ